MLALGQKNPLHNIKVAEEAPHVLKVRTACTACMTVCTHKRLVTGRQLMCMIKVAKAAHTKKLAAAVPA